MKKNKINFLDSSNKALRKFADIEVREFLNNGKFPLEPRLFFIQHLIPYICFKHLCENNRVLEIGIGDGFGSYYLSKDFLKIIAFDLDLSSYYLLKNYLNRYKVNNIDFVNGNAVNLPFKNNSFDGIITCQVIEHIPTEKLIDFLREISRILKTNGVCLIVTLNVEHNIKNPLTYNKFAQHHKEFNRDELKTLLAKAFGQIEIFGLNITPKHYLFQRFKKLGLMKYKPNNLNPAVNFYQNVLPKEFVISKRISKSAIDLIAVCKKT